MRPTLRLACLSLLAVYVLCLATASAQNATGAISGTVTDPSGAVLKGAQVSIPAQGVTVVSNAQGQFVIKGLASGSYSLRVSYIGFATFEKDAVAVAAGQTTNVTAALQ